jgi:hypothetical protein
MSDRVDRDLGEALGSGPLGWPLGCRESEKQVGANRDANIEATFDGTIYLVRVFGTNSMRTMSYNSTMSPPFAVVENWLSGTYTFSPCPSA